MNRCKFILFLKASRDDPTIQMTSICPSLRQEAKATNFDSELYNTLYWPAIRLQIDDD